MNAPMVSLTLTMDEARYLREWMRTVESETIIEREKPLARSLAYTIDNAMDARNRAESDFNKAIERAREGSRGEAGGVTVHLNKRRDGSYFASDWFGDSVTVASFFRGEQTY